MTATAAVWQSCLAITDGQLQVTRTAAFHTARCITLLHEATYVFATTCSLSSYRFQSVDAKHKLQGIIAESSALKQCLPGCQAKHARHNLQNPSEDVTHHLMNDTFSSVAEC